MSSIKRNIGIDVIKAMALISVIIYHLYEFKGTYIGVIIFFVISGYFISSVLTERDESYFLFLKRRFTKIYPLLIVVLTVVFFLFYLLNDSLTLNIIKSSLFTLMGLSNIYQIKSGMSYFERTGDMYPLLHTWSLAIEIQFYLIFPFLINFTKKLKLDSKKMAYFMLFLSLISASLMFFKKFSTVDISEIYYGSDTRFFSLFMGSAYYFYFKDREINKKIFINLAYFSLGIIFLSMILVSYDMPINYYGLMYLISFLSGLVVIANMKANFLNADSDLLRNIANIGKHSYCYYLWQYPLMIFSREYFKWTDIKYNYTVFMQIFILVILSEISYEFLEKREIMAKKIGKIVSIIYIFSLFFFPVTQETNSQILQNRIEEINIEIQIKNLEKDEKSYEDPLEKRLLDIENKKYNKETIVETVKDEEKPLKNSDDIKKNITIDKEINHYVFIGDSVMKMAEPLLKKKFEPSYVDAKVSRQFVELPKILEELVSKNGLGNKVIIHLGTNGVINKKSFERSMEILNDREVFFMNCVVPKFWEESINNNLRLWAKDYSNVKIIDWYKYAKGKKELFYKDATHLTKDGAQKYVNFIYSIVEN